MTAALGMRDLSTNERTQLNFRICAMRVIACMAIVLLHTANVAEILYREQITLTQRAVSMGIVYEMMWAVPVFLMVSGSLLLPPEKEITTQTSLTRYALRILIVLIAFVFLFRFFDMVMNGEGFSVSLLSDALLKLFTGTSWSHLWYLYLLIGIYVLLPFYKMIAEKADEKQLRYLLLVYALFLSLLPLTRMAGVSSAFTIQTAAIYLFYFFAGYACAKNILNFSKGTAVCGLLLSTALIALLTHVRFAYDAAFLETVLNSYASPLVLVQTLSVFTLLYREKKAEEGEKVFGGRLITFLDENSFGIYLVHMIFIRYVFRYRQVTPYAFAPLSFIVYAAVFFVASCFAVFLLRRIPLIRKVL